MKGAASSLLKKSIRNVSVMPIPHGV